MARFSHIQTKETIDLFNVIFNKKENMFKIIYNEELIDLDKCLTEDSKFNKKGDVLVEKLTKLLNDLKNEFSLIEWLIFKPEKLNKFLRDYSKKDVTDKAELDLIEYIIHLKQDIFNIFSITLKDIYIQIEFCSFLNYLITVERKLLKNDKVKYENNIVIEKQIKEIFPSIYNDIDDICTIFSEGEIIPEEQI